MQSGLFTRKLILVFIHSTKQMTSGFPVRTCMIFSILKLIKSFSHFRTQHLIFRNYINKPMKPNFAEFSKSQISTTCYLRIRTKIFNFVYIIMNAKGNTS